MNRSVIRSTLFFSLFMLFGLQLLADLIETVYTFALCSIALVPEIGFVLILLSPLLLLIFGDGRFEKNLMYWAGIIILCRIMTPIAGSGIRLEFAAAGTGMFLLFFPAWLWRAGRQKPHETAWAAGMGLAVALLLSIFFRAAGSGLDISTHGVGRLIGWGLCAAAGWLILSLRGELADNPSPETGRDKTVASKPEIFAAGIGITGVLALAYFGFMAPNVISRWADLDHTAVTAVLALALAGYTAILTTNKGVNFVFRRDTALILNGLFVLSLTAALFNCQVALPDDPGAYPVFAPSETFLAAFLLVVSLLSFPVILLNFTAYVQTIGTAKCSFRWWAGSFLAGTALLLLLVCGHIFTIVYDYVPVAGPYFRNRFWLVYLVAALSASLPAVYAGRRPLFPLRIPGGKLRFAWVGLAGLLAAGAICGTRLTAAHPVPPGEDARRLAVLTYNIQQGYTEDAQRGCRDQLAVIRDSGADVIGLQETDTNRITQGNNDVIRYYADRLNMYSYYGPSPVAGTFGVALLSRYPIQNPRTAFLYSYSDGMHESEQTAAIVAEITVGGRLFTVIVTHLGNGGPAAQQEAILKCAGSAERVILMGDFNSSPGEAAYQMAVGFLEDSWLLAGGGKSDGREIKNSHRIDHIFVSPGTGVESSRYLIGPQSDHPALLTRIAW